MLEKKMIRKIILLILILATGVWAQKFSHVFNVLPARAEGEKKDTVKILAVMVEFAADDNPNTYGNGAFGSIYTKDYGTQIIDPLPHDKKYFEKHLSFAADYFKKASHGKTIIVYSVVPEVIRLSKTMLDYSPDIGSSDVSVMGGFVLDVWKQADEQTDVDFSAYDLFMIFHAGVGRDVTLPGSLGLERDLPSVYFSLNALKGIFGSSFDGFRVQNGSFKITNSAVLPETESREMNTFGGSSLVELSINGLIVSTVASYLGLPDLFDTETGKSAIGRFGLMDGQSIFAYGGCFPPLPSAWERIFLGWEKPVTLDSSAKNINIFAISDSASTVYKIPITDKEYFLLENRQRDLNSDGAKITMWNGGRSYSKSFGKDADGFYSWDVSSLEGVITAVDEYDWALPGSGILIWHIDENVIDEHLADNKINADPEHRGVDLEEADGIQDIGVEFHTIFGDVVIGEGDANDFWFKGNPSRLYRNEFGADTKPNSDSYYGGSSMITVSDFSENGKEMTFDLNFGGGIVSSKSVFYYEPDGKVSDLLAFSHRAAAESVFFLDDSSLVEISENGFLNYGKFSSTGLASVELGNGNRIIAGFLGKRINIFSVDENKIIASVEAPALLTSYPVFKKERSIKLLAGDAEGFLNVYDLDNIGTPTFVGRDKYLDDLPVECVATSLYTVVAGKNILADSEGNKYTFPSGSDIEKVALTQDDEGNFVVFVKTVKGNLWSATGDFDFRLAAKNVSDFAFGNLLGDGNNYAVYSSGDKIYALTLTDAVADNFPYENPSGADFRGGIRTADLNGDGIGEIVAYDINGNLFVIDSKKGATFPLFPFALSEGATLPLMLYSSAGNSANPVLVQMSVKGRISRVNFSWDAPSAPQIYWGSEHANAENSCFLSAPEKGEKNKEFFPQAEAYNWPNPVYGESTYIHYYVAEDSEIEITILDLSGQIVKKIRTEAQGGFASQTEWNVKNVQSGVYFAHLKAQGTSGKTAYKIIKIVVIH